MDWNWFFSSVAQSGAAIVGIFGAFIITKIINNQQEFTKKNRAITELLTSSLRLEGAILAGPLSWYTKHVLKEAIKAVNKKLEDESHPRLPEEYLKEIPFHQFISREEALKAIELAIINFKPKNKSNDLDYSSFAIPTKNLVTIEFDKELRQKKEQVQSQLVEVKHHTRMVKNFIMEIEGNPESSRLILFSVWAVLVLFYGSVIYPLSFLPLATGAGFQISLSAFWGVLFSIRGLILAILAFIFTLVLMVFLVINSRLKYKKDQIEKLKFYSQIENYSKYYKAMIQNLDMNTSDPTNKPTTESES